MFWISVFLVFDDGVDSEFVFMFFCLGESSQELELGVQVSSFFLLLAIFQVKGLFDEGKLRAFLEILAGQFVVLFALDLHIVSKSI